MTAQELKQFNRDTLIAPRSIAQEITVFDALIDFISQSDTSDIPEWDDALTFNSDGSGAGAFATFPDSNNKVRLWKSKTMANTNNEPPEDPLVTENADWIEVSPATGSAIKEWAPGIYGAGLIIVFHDLTGAGLDPALYVLTNPTRPFESTDFPDELDAGDWARLSSDIKFAKVTITSAEILDLFDTPKELVPAPGVNKFIELISGAVLYNYDSVAYTGAGAGGIHIGYMPDPVGANYSNSGIDITGITSKLIKQALDNNVNYAQSVIVNKALGISAAVSNPAAGDGEMVVYVTYRISTIT